MGRFYCPRDGTIFVPTFFQDILQGELKGLLGRS